jgi:hypothetical protein
MRRFYQLSKHHLFAAWLFVTTPYLLLKFGVSLIPNVPQAEVWNDIGKDFFLTLSTSLLFWFVAEWLAAIIQGRKVLDTQRLFLNEAMRLFNAHVHSLTNEVFDVNTEIPSYIDSVTQFDLEQFTDKWTLRSAAKLGWPLASLESGSHNRVKQLINNLRDLRTEYDPYHSQFSMSFNKAINELFRTTRFFLDDGQPESLQGGLTLLSVTRDRLVAIENVHRSQMGEPPMIIPRR